MQIFGRRLDENLPFFTNLYILRESNHFLRYVMNEMSTFSVPFVIFMNTFYYYGNKIENRGKELRFSRLPRTIKIFIVYFFLAGAFYEPYCRNNYKININNLLDRNEPFLFDNEAFKALI